MGIVKDMLYGILVNVLILSYFSIQAIIETY